MGVVEDIREILDIIGPAYEVVTMLSGKCWRCDCGLLQPWAHEVCGDEDEDWGGCGRLRDEGVTLVVPQIAEITGKKFEAWREGLYKIARDIIEEE